MNIKEPNIKRYFVIVIVLCLLFLLGSCKKGSQNPAPTPTPITTTTTPTASQPTTIYLSGGTYNKLYISVSSPMTSQYNCVLVTSSNGLVLDATNTLPYYMVTSSGIVVPGDSIVYNGITVTNKTFVYQSGDLLGGAKIYGNLAYANIVLGDQFGNSLTINRLPFLFYYKAIDSQGSLLAPHVMDMFGIGSGTHDPNIPIGNPLLYIPSVSGLTSGFKLSLMNFSKPILSPNLAQSAPGKLIIGLLPSDLQTSAGFVMHQLSPDATGNYSDVINGAITYGSTTVSGSMKFNTGYLNSIIQNSQNAIASTTLNFNTSVKAVTNNNFTYQYLISSSTDATIIENPTASGTSLNVFGIDFFMSNEYLVDYKDHQIGLKVN